MIPALLGCHVTQVSSPVPIPLSWGGLSPGLPKSLIGAASKRQAEFLAGRSCALHALVRAGCDLPDRDREIGIGADRAPLWPPGWVGSITHSQGRASAAVARASRLAGLGIDSEAVMSERSAGNVMARVLTVFEQDGLARLPEVGSSRWSEAEWVTLVFSAKESLYKCLRPLTGEFFDFQAAELTEVDPVSGIFGFRLMRPLEGGFAKGWTGRGRFARSPGWVHTAVDLERDYLSN